MQERKFARGVAEETLLNDPRLLRLVLGELPAWVRSGRYERTEWLNGALQTLWPSLERALSRRLLWHADRALGALAPGFVRRVRVEELSLGSVAPRITGVLCAEEECDHSGGGVELEAEVRWSCDGRALLAFDLRAGRRLTFPVHDLCITGLLRVRLAPLCARPPGFEALQLCFAAPPDVRYRLSGVGAMATSIPGFAAYLQRCLGDALAAACVWPRRLTLPLPQPWVGRDPALSRSQLGSPACGVLRVVVVEAQELSPAELLGLRDVALPGAQQAGVSTSPYVHLELPEPPGGGRAGAQRESSVHRRNNLAPRWDEAFCFVVDDPATQRLRVTVRAWDAGGMAGSHSVMGETAVPLAGLRPGCEEEAFWALSMVVPKSVTVQGVMATYRVPSFGGELEELPAGKVRLSLLYTPFKANRGARNAAWQPGGADAASSSSSGDGESEEELVEESDGSSASSDNEGEEDGEGETPAALARRRERRMVRRAARRRVMRRLQRGGRAQRGVLLVRLERGVELCRAHGPARPADCYVTVQLAGEHRREVRKTRVVSASRNPVWNADFALFVDDAARAELLLSAFDFSGLEAHIPMGAVRLPLLDVVAEQGGGPGVRASYRLEGAPLGHLHLWLEWRAY